MVTINGIGPGKSPEEVVYIIDRLEGCGYEAFAVGGCVRDSLMGNEPEDWDICTSALPEETAEVFKGGRIIETGLKHGTITLMLNHKPYEVTTYRVDGAYSDNRRPDAVEFVRDLKEDLARRDFTINAMAYNPRRGVIDCFGGLADLHDGVIRCVGDADKRFKEDALRIMRALRFASTLRSPDLAGFHIQEDTGIAIRNNVKLLKNISAERVARELNKFVLGGNIVAAAFDSPEILFEVIPELKPARGFEQNNHRHCMDVFGHVLWSVSYAPEEIPLRLTMLLHDVAKPFCYTEDEEGTGHFHGHQQLGSEMAKTILSRLKYDNETIDTVVQLILRHDDEIPPDRKPVRKFLNRLGEKRLRQLIEVKRADVNAQAPQRRDGALKALDRVEELIDEIIGQRQCFSLEDLAVNGRDLISIGITEGVEIGDILNMLLNMVMDETAGNDRDELLKIAGEWRRGQP